MQLFAGIAILLLIATSLVVGLRLVGQGTRQHGIPELMLGAMLVLSVGLGYPLMIAADRVEGTAARVLFVVSVALVNGGFAFLFLFTRRVFRPDAGWARVLTTAGLVALGANLVMRGLEAATQPEVKIATDAVGSSLLQIGPVLLGYCWCSAESFRYYGMMRRRLALGMGDAVVCNRFLLWGANSLAVAVGTLANGVAVVQGVDVFGSPLVLLASSTTGLSQVALLVLAFMPPGAYREWLAGGSPTAA
jgi:hypothetical protein